MTLLVLGLALFLGAHLIPATPALNRRLTAALGPLGRKSVVALGSIAGLTLIVIGWQRAPFVPVYTPPDGARYVTAALMVPAMILLVAAYTPSNIKRFTRHPMLWGAVLWAGGHLLSNGDLRSLVLFGALGIWALFDMVSANRRGTEFVREQYTWAWDAATLLIGLGALLLIARFHDGLFGVPIGMF